VEFLTRRGTPIQKKGTVGNSNWVPTTLPKGEVEGRHSRNPLKRINEASAYVFREEEIDAPETGRKKSERRGEKELKIVVSPTTGRATAGSTW